jgi:hypothetical protein
MRATLSLSLNKPVTIFGSPLDDAAFVIAFSQSLSARKLLEFYGFWRLWPASTDAYSDRATM